jgi:hypothetical protein
MKPRLSIHGSLPLFFAMGMISNAPQLAKAQQGTNPTSPESKVRLDAASVFNVNYGSPLWNKDSKSIDTAVIMARDAKSGRVVQVQVSETAPDSGIFSGKYLLGFGDLKNHEVALFVPEKVNLSDLKETGRFLGDIQSGKISPKPLVVRKSADGKQNLELFDNQEQADRAEKALKDQDLENARATNKLIPQNIPSEQDLEALALRNQELNRRERSENIAERIRLEQLETKRLELLTEEFNKASLAVQTERRAKAETLSREAMRDYQARRFVDAQKKFASAIELDPTSRDIFFQYGVSLYKVDQFNKSIVYLLMTNTKKVNPAERHYFLGLNHFQLKEYQQALESFARAETLSDKEISPSAAFYRGLIFYEDQKCDQAQPAFQKVLDTSTDPNLDKQAETYLEQCVRNSASVAEKKRLWTYALTFGEMVDSNVTLSSISTLSQGAPTDALGYRSLAQGAIKYRPLTSENRELAIQLDASTTYTLDKEFKTSQTLRDTDPTVLTLSVPLTAKGALLSGRFFKFDIIPGYEVINMSIDNNIAKNIIGSLFLNFNNLIVMNEKWLTYINAELRKDQSALSTSIGDDDSTALKVKLSWNNAMLRTKEKNHILGNEAALTVNSANGKNYIFQRYDLAVSYTKPWYFESQASVKLGYYYLTYPHRSIGRMDNNGTLTAAFTKKLTDLISWGALTSFSYNDSNVEASRYSKWTALLTLSSAGGF